MDQAQNLRNIIKAGSTKEVLSRVITITSGKGGVGKSNLAINIAIELGRLGKKVIVMDGLWTCQYRSYAWNQAAI